MQASSSKRLEYAGFGPAARVLMPPVPTLTSALFPRAELRTAPQKEKWSWLQKHQHYSPAAAASSCTCTLNYCYQLPLLLKHNYASTFYLQHNLLCLPLLKKGNLLILLLFFSSHLLSAERLSDEDKNTRLSIGLDKRVTEKERQFLGYLEYRTLYNQLLKMLFS